ncbi:peroxisome proliferator-activated receptor gamma coactivator-related protein 1-like isoform X1 [Sinocyclocheilus rhinocerous]|uniref:Peroxisome proliferator-activated receptor gamma coactivator-related protein 1-like n=1 Tax=Sinocyclocheilus rhinocerous TaxID=307959 RepID=A0A673J188_9TELE|nr:PREDICTED: peroxisome proliferator-activated receptor gamma coactivator-related protein 1-like isoform X1 [Sinocyclocheilus rhinocerous]
MAARWGTGEEMLKACNTQMFSPVNLDEVEMLKESFNAGCLEYPGLSNGDALEALQGCLDPSILSIFEDSPTGGVKSNIDEESEATLLTALTEILDNVDDENLSPFDTLPDSELFSGQKGQEHSPLRKLITRSPPESMIDTRQFPGKSLPRMQRLSQQNSEGEEEEDGDANPIANIDLSSLDEFDWCLPVSLEQDGESMHVTICDLVKHMHPYCMTLCVEGEEGQEHLLPERGLVLEVVDQGEHGEPILAIPDLSIPLSHTYSAEGEQRVPENTIDKPEPKPEDSAEKVPAPSEVSFVEEEKEVVKVCKGKKKCKLLEAPLVEQRVLRSSRVKEEPQKKCQEEQKKKRVTFSPVLSSAELGKPKLDCPTDLMTLNPQVEKEHITTPQAEAEITDSQPENKLLEKSVEQKPPSKLEPVSEQPAACQPNETKPKPLSLQQYRLLRQQKKPEPVDKTEDYSTKWPKLPEPPKELPPIPCLPDPNPRDPRKTMHTPVKKDLAPEIMPAWHPRGPSAPPTPEALITPPASLMASSKKPATSKPTAPPSDTSKSSPQSVHPSPQKLPAPIGVPQNTIHTETSAPIRHVAEVPPERTVSLPVSTTSGGSQGLNAQSHKECLHGSPNAAPSKIPSRPQMVTTQVQNSNSSPHKPSAAVSAKRETEQVVLAPVSDQAKNTLPTNSKKPHIAPIAAQPFFSAQVQARVVELAEQMRMASSEIPKLKNTTVELIESFTSEIGIEAADLTSLLEQFEESQSKEEQSVPEVCGRAAAVGNSSFEFSYEQHVETKVVEKTRNHDLGSTAGLTPPATPPHQMWKPIAPVSLLGKTEKSEVLKPTPNKAIQIEARPLPSNKLRSKPQTPTITGQTQPFSLDHDYCLPPKEPCQNEVGSRWNVKQQPSIVIKTVELPPNKLAQNTKATSTPSVTEGTQRNLSLSQPSADRSCTLNSSTLVTPDASPNRPDSESSVLDEAKCNQQKSVNYSEHSFRQYQQDRGRSKRRYRAQSSSSLESSSESSSRSRSQPRKRYRSRHSSCRSSSSSQSRSRSSSRSFSPPQRRRYSYSSSRSGFWSRSRSRSRSRSSDSLGHRRWKSHRSPNQRAGYWHSQNCNEDAKRCKERAIEERRVVYVGRIRGSMTRKELKERFSFFGEIEECTVHFRENGDNYGFVTYYNKKDAFDAIENGSKLREQNELPFDLCFGGRRQFCKTSYADLDSNREYNPRPTKGKFDALDFDTLLKQAQRNLKR